LLKFEWKRVKDGEPSYKTAKKISIIVLCLGLALAILDIGYIATTTKQSKKSAVMVQKEKAEIEIPNKANSTDAKSRAAD